MFTCFIFLFWVDFGSLKLKSYQETVLFFFILSHFPWEVFYLSTVLLGFSVRESVIGSSWLRQKKKKIWSENSIPFFFFFGSRHIENNLKFILEDEVHRRDAYSVEKRMPFVKHLNKAQRIISTQSKYSAEIWILCVCVAWCNRRFIFTS